MLYGVNQTRHLLTEMSSLGQDNALQGGEHGVAAQSTQELGGMLAQQSNPDLPTTTPFYTDLPLASAEADMSQTTRQHGSVPQLCICSYKMCSKYLSMSSGEVLCPSLPSTLVSVKVPWKSRSRKSQYSLEICEVGKYIKHQVRNKVFLVKATILESSLL